MPVRKLNASFLVLDKLPFCQVQDVQQNYNYISHVQYQHRIPDFEVVLENAEIVFLDTEESENLLLQLINAKAQHNCTPIVCNSNEVQRELLPMVTTKAYISDIDQTLIHQPEIKDQNEVNV